MGVGYAEDLVVCSALGVDMYDCVFPTRTARFGNALTRCGSLNLNKAKYKNDFSPIDPACFCPTCKTQTRAMIYQLLENNETNACHLLSLHNIAYQMRLMRDIRSSIEQDEYPAFVKQFMRTYYKENAGDKTSETQNVKGKNFDAGKVLSERGYPVWIENALNSVGIELE
jgi:queuine tRNA-ribosyltransferase